MDKSSTQKISEKTLALNGILEQMELVDTHEIFHLKISQYTIFSSAHGTLSMIDHILGNKIHLNKFKKTENISSSFFLPKCYETRNQLQEEKKKKKKLQKMHMWKLNNMLVKQPKEEQTKIK